MESYMADMFYYRILFEAFFLLIAAIVGGGIIYYLSGFLPWPTENQKKVLRLAAWAISFPLFFGLLAGFYWGGTDRFFSVFPAAIQLFFLMPPLNYPVILVWILGALIVIGRELSRKPKLIKPSSGTP